jgi:2,4-dienoyl-CoA reductase-like NADH-dependent reductase (Old Yellow Enzyme family)
MVGAASEGSVRRGYIANERFTLATAEEVVARGDADAVAFGKLWIANPDLVERFRRRSELNEPQAATFYSHGAEGYSDYPAQG